MLKKVGEIILEALGALGSIAGMLGLLFGFIGYPTIDPDMVFSGVFDWALNAIKSISPFLILFLGIVAGWHVRRFCVFMNTPSPESHQTASAREDILSFFRHLEPDEKSLFREILNNGCAYRPTEPRYYLSKISMIDYTATARGDRWEFKPGIQELIEQSEDIKRILNR